MVHFDEACVEVTLEELMSSIYLVSWEKGKDIC